MAEKDATNRGIIVVALLTLLMLAAVALFELPSFMGTSPQMLDRTHGHLLPDALDRTRAVLDSFIAVPQAEAFGHTE
jgi:hypothetical protein